MADVTISGGTTNGNILPASTGQDIGSDAQRWDVNAQHIDASGTVTHSGDTAIKNLSGILFADQFSGNDDTEKVQAAIDELTGSDHTGLVLVPASMEPEFDDVDLGGETTVLQVTATGLKLYGRPVYLDTQLTTDSTITVNNGAVILEQNDTYVRWKSNGFYVYLQAGDPPSGPPTRLADSTFTFPDLADGGVDDESGFLLGFTGATEAAAVGNALFCSHYGLMEDSDIGMNQFVSFPLPSRGIDWNDDTDSGRLLSSSLSGDRTWTLPDATGTIALSKLYTPSLSPVAVAANTTAEQTFSVSGLTTSDTVIVNKPTAQAGLGIVGCRVSAADTLAINFSNNTGSPITPTAAETYRVVAIRS